MKTRTLKAIMALIMICITLSSCSLMEKAAEVSAPDDSSKYNAYIELSNYMSGWLNLDLQGYFEEFGFDEEIYIKEGFGSGESDNAVVTPIIQGFFDKVDKTLEYASKKPSYDSTDEAIKTLCPKLKELLSTINEIDSYYRSKTFADDNFAKGKELHKKIFNQYKEYSELAGKFHDEFSVITQKKVQEDLDKLKKNDQLIRYYALSVVVRAQNMEKELYSFEASHENMLDYDFNKYKEQYELLKNDIDKFMEYIKDEKRLEKEGYKNNASFGMLKSSMEYLKASATELYQIFEAKDYNAGKENKGGVYAATSDGSILDEFNKFVSILIDEYNKTLH